MRRRDATDTLPFSGQRLSWPTVVCLALSLGLHAMLLRSARLVAIGVGAPAPVIRLSLLNQRDGGEPAGPPASAAVASAPQISKQPQSRARVPHHAAATSHAAESRAHAAVPSHSADNETSALVQLAGVTNDGGGAAPGGSGTGVGGSDGSSSGGGDQRPYCLYCPAPHYPLLARRRGWQGTVLVGLSVLADGSVESASLRQSSGYGVLDREAIAVARQSRFSPPAARGLPAPVRGPMEYRFELSNADAGRGGGR